MQTRLTLFAIIGLAVCFAAPNIGWAGNEGPTPQARVLSNSVGSAQTQKSTGTTRDINFKGLYLDTSDTFMDRWLRFYEDGVVLAATLGRGTTVEKVEQSLRKPAEITGQSKVKVPGLYSAGRFRIQGSKIYFSLTSPDKKSASGSVEKGATIEYEGTIGENSIHVNWLSLTTGNSGTENYEFVPLPASQTPAASQTSTPTPPSGPKSPSKSKRPPGTF